MLKIKVLNVSKKDLLRDLQRAPEFDQSALFKKVYEEEYGVFGGTPFGALVGDYYFDKSGQDIELLEKISNVAAAAHAPFLIGGRARDVQPRELHRARHAARPGEDLRHAPSTRSGRASASSEDSRYVALTAPRVLMREPYGAATVPDRGVQLRGARRRHRPRPVPAGATRPTRSAANVNKAFAMYGWCATIRGVESGGLVEGLPVHNFRTESGDIAMKCPTEVQITDRREKELADLGFAPLVHQKGTANAAFFSVQSAQKPKVYDDRRGHRERAAVGAAAVHLRDVALRALPEGDDARQDRRLHVAQRGRLRSSTAGSRTTSSLEVRPSAIKAHASRCPRRGSTWSRCPGKPGAYRAVAFLRPHFQLDELGVVDAPGRRPAGAGRLTGCTAGFQMIRMHDSPFHIPQETQCRST